MFAIKSYANHFHNFSDYSMCLSPLQAVLHSRIRLSDHFLVEPEPETKFLRLAPAPGT
jgi:hypothetical protein